MGAEVSRAGGAGGDQERRGARQPDGDRLGVRRFGRAADVSGRDRRPRLHAGADPAEPGIRDRLSVVGDGERDALRRDDARTPRGQRD